MSDHQRDKCILLNPKHDDEQDAYGKRRHNIGIDYRHLIRRLHSRSHSRSGIEGSDSPSRSQDRRDQGRPQREKHRPDDHVPEFFCREQRHVIVQGKTPDSSDRR